MCHIFWHSVKISAGSGKRSTALGRRVQVFLPKNAFAADKFSNKFQHLTKQNLFVAQRFLGHNCLRQHRCVRGQRVRLSHSMEISASLTKLFFWNGKSVQPLPSRHPKRFRNAVPKSTRPTKATFVTHRFLGHNCWLARCAHVRVPRYMSKRTAAREPWPRSRVRVNVPVF